MTRERATALLSAMLAIAILGAAVTAQPSRSTPSDRLARLESDLRYQLDLDSRLDRATFHDRSKSLDHTLDAWRKSPQSPSDYELVTAWLREALMRSLPGESGAWPATPEFGANARVVRKEIVEDASRAETPPTSQAVATSKNGTQRTVVDEKPVERRPQTRSAVTESDKRTRTAPSVSAAPVVPAEKAPAIEHSITQKPPSANATETEIAKRTAPTPSQTAAVYSEVTVTPVAADTEPTKPVEVNFAELNARIGGYHEGLREIEAAVVADQDKMTVAAVAKLVGQLEQLAGQYEFVRLYYDALTREEQHFVMTPRSLAPTIELVERQRAHAEAAGEEDFFSANDSSKDESDLAARLKDLAELAGE
jgi:hypothetical protein